MPIITSINELDLIDLFVNILACGEHISKCTNENADHSRMETFSVLCIESLKAKWKTEWGVFNQIIPKLLKADRSFVEDLNDSFLNKNLFVEFFKTIQQELFVVC